jgi:hypothetical protein
MRKLLNTTALSFLFLSWALPAWSKPASRSAVIKVLQITSERVCVPQVPGDLDSGVLCGEGFRVAAESKEFYIEAVMLAALSNVQPIPSVGTHFAGIVGGNFLSILDGGDVEKAKIVSSLNIEVFKPKQESRRSD